MVPFTPISGSPLLEKEGRNQRGAGLVAKLQRRPPTPNRRNRRIGGRVVDDITERSGLQSLGQTKLIIESKTDANAMLVRLLVSSMIFSLLQLQQPNMIWQLGRI